MSEECSVDVRLVYCCVKGDVCSPSILGVSFCQETKCYCYITIVVVLLWFLL